MQALFAEIENITLSMYIMEAYSACSREAGTVCTPVRREFRTSFVGILMQGDQPTLRSSNMTEHHPILAPGMPVFDDGMPCTASAAENHQWRIRPFARVSTASQIFSGVCTRW